MFELEESSRQVYSDCIFYGRHSLQSEYNLPELKRLKNRGYSDKKHLQQEGAIVLLLK